MGHGGNAILDLTKLCTVEKREISEGSNFSGFHEFSGLKKVMYRTHLNREIFAP